MEESSAGRRVLDEVLDATAEDMTKTGSAAVTTSDDPYDDEITNLLGQLSAETRTAMNHFRQSDYLKVLSMIDSSQPQVREAIEKVGQELASSIDQAAATQYAMEEELSLSGGEKEAISESQRMSNKQRLSMICKFTPLRLVYEEREILRLLESTLYISDYTDQIDIYHSGNKNQQIVRQIKQICSILTGLVMARNYEEGKRLLKDRDFRDLEKFFQGCFEIGRRYKILNPERMRESYGKLMYFMMDTQNKSVLNTLEFGCVSEIKTVYELLQRKKNGLDLLDDPLLLLATKEIYETDPAQARLWSDRKIKATQELVRKYATIKNSPGSSLKEAGRYLGRRFLSVFGGTEEPSSLATQNKLKIPRTDDWLCDELSEEDVELAIYSLKDHMTFLRFNERPVDLMYTYLTSMFHPQEVETGFSLAIEAGREGARLTHHHTRQFQYVKQSLLLWREVLRNFFRLWMAADADMLSDNVPYRLRETGQGLNRIQSSPSVYAVMSEVVRTVQREAGSWIGSSAIHLGDHNVPNALMFIDKYTQVPRIVQPIISVLDQIEPLCRRNAHVHKMINEQFGSPLRLKKVILCDFFKHAFDGSGGDNFFDAGSCIDGRLTSAWNWCNTIDKKPFYHVFLLCGFVGFDGKF